MTRSIPGRCIFETGYSCNLECLNCRVRDKKYGEAKLKGRERISAAEFAGLARSLAENGIERIMFIGGEPLAEDDFFSYPRAAKAAGIRETGMVTNGTLIDEKTADLIAESGLLDTVVFSLDGGAQTHDFLRGRKGAFEKALRGLSLVTSRKRKLKLKKPKIFIYMTIFPCNASEMEKVFMTGLMHNVNKVRFQTFSRPDPDGKGIPLKWAKNYFHSYAVNCDSCGKADMEETRRNFSRISETARKRGVKIEAEEIIKSGENRECRFLEKDFVISAAGDIIPCPMLPNVSIGNLREDGIREIFSAGREIIESLKNEAESGKLPICRQCCVEKIVF